jgi:butyryl-CoA dehydrogenase
MSEPGAGSDIASIRCKAELDGDEWVINGQKMWVTFADGANYLVVVARTEPYDPKRRHAGIRQFFVPKEPGSFPEGITGTPMRKIGYHGWKTWELAFDDVRIPRHYVLGGRKGDAPDADPNEGFKRAARHMAIPRVHTAARALMYSVANDADNGAMRAREAAMCKLFASDMAEEVTSQALQIYGGSGYTSEYAIERYWRDARLTRIFEGTSEIQMKIISDSLLPRPGRK